MEICHNLWAKISERKPKNNTKIILFRTSELGLKWYISKRLVPYSEIRGSGIEPFVAARFGITVILLAAVGIENYGGIGIERFFSGMWDYRIFRKCDAGYYRISIAGRGNKSSLKSFEYNVWTARLAQYFGKMAKTFGRIVALDTHPSLL